MSDQPNVLLFLDRADVGTHFNTFLHHNDISSHLYMSATEIYQRMEEGFSDVSAVFIHKDLGVMVVGQIRQVAPYVRIILVSDEFPDGERHARRMKVDYYCSPSDLREHGIAQIQKGPVSLAEQLLRGIHVHMPLRDGNWARRR